jgi:hypothetical protein
MYCVVRIGDAENIAVFAVSEFPHHCRMIAAMCKEHFGGMWQVRACATGRVVSEGESKGEEALLVKE